MSVTLNDGTPPAPQQPQAEGRAATTPAELLTRATELGLVELIDFQSAPVLRRALEGRAQDRNELVAIRIVPASVAKVDTAWIDYPMHELARLAPIVVDLSSIVLPATSLMTLLAHLHHSSGPDGKICLVTGSVQRRAELYAITRPRVPAFTSLADALQTLVFASQTGPRRWSTQVSSTALPSRR